MRARGDASRRGAARGRGIAAPLGALALVELALAASPDRAAANLGQPDESLARRLVLDPGTPTAGSARPGADPSAPSPGDRLEPEPAAPEPGDVQLFPRLPLARAAGWLLPPEPSPSDREEQAEAELEAYFDGELHRDRLAAGVVDGWYHVTGRAMRQRFRPDRQALERERHAGMTPLQILYDELRRHAAPRERPMDVPGQTPPELRAAVTDRTDREQAVEQEWWDWCNALNSPTTWYRVDLRVTHNPEGVLSAVWVHRSSGYRSLDEAALQAAREGSIALDPPPERVVGERQAIQSDWAFELGDVATPIACMNQSGAAAQLMCVDDPIHGTMCAIAGRGIVRTRVTLLGVVDAEHESEAERRARRRADPDRSRP